VHKLRVTTILNNDIDYNSPTIARFHDYQSTNALGLLRPPPAVPVGGPWHRALLLLCAVRCCHLLSAPAHT